MMHCKRFLNKNHQQHLLHCLIPQKWIPFNDPSWTLWNSYVDVTSCRCHTATACWFFGGVVREPFRLKMTNFRKFNILSYTLRSTLTSSTDIQRSHQIVWSYFTVFPFPPCYAALGAAATPFPPSQDVRALNRRGRSQPEIHRWLLELDLEMEQKKFKDHLVGGFNPFETFNSQIGSFPQIRTSQNIYTPWN